MRAIVRSGTTWWCLARFWADRVQLHPTLSLAVQTLKLANSLPLSAVLRASVSQHAQILQFDMIEENACLLFRAKSDADPRIRARAPFRADTSEGAHVIRVAARVVALSFRPEACAKLTRYDLEGIESIDVEASSSQVWTQWAHSLSNEQRKDLRLWRGGAVPLPTRRHWRRKLGQLDVPCPWCDSTRPSARHMFVECCRFRPLRREHEAEFRIPPAWWQSQPEGTTKSGWITFNAARVGERRAALQVAPCKLGICIVQACFDPG